MDQLRSDKGEPVMEVGGVRVSCAEVLLGAAQLISNLSRKQARGVLVFLVRAFRTKFGTDEWRGDSQSPRLEGEELTAVTQELFEQAKGDLLDRVASHLASAGESSGDLPCLRYVVGQGLGYLPMVIPEAGWEGHSNPVGELVLVPTFAGVHDANCLPSCKGGRLKYEPLLEEAVRNLLPVPTHIRVGQYEGVIAEIPVHQRRIAMQHVWCGQASGSAPEPRDHHFGVDDL